MQPGHYHQKLEDEVALEAMNEASPLNCRPFEINVPDNFETVHDAVSELNHILLTFFFLYFRRLHIGLWDSISQMQFY